MTIAPKDMKITYTSTNVDMSAFHAVFDAALETLRASLGRTYPLLINGKEVMVDGATLTDTTPIDTRVVLGHFQAAKVEHINAAVAGARTAWKSWKKTPWPERVTIMRKAAELVRERKFDLAATMSLEVGKNRLESIGDAEESADLIDYYCQQLEDAHGFVQTMDKITPIETNTDVLRPYGVFACVAPFNFPAALSAGMSSAALVAGNAVVYKPATDAPLTGFKLAEIYRDAGIPAGVFQYLSGRGSDMGDALVFHKGVDGVVFTGSKPVGMRIFHGMSTRWIKPCLLEMGGKNPAIVMPTADLDAAAEGIAKSAWGLQNQKCSACSRVYVHRDVAAALIDRIKTRTVALVIGDPCDEGVYLGPVINAKAVKTWERAVAQAKTEGEVLMGGERLTDGALSHGFYVAPTLVTAPLQSTLFREEFFAPILAIGIVDSLDQAIEESNKAEYGLTAGIFTGKEAELAEFFEEIEAGVTYANKRTGATTGAWPGAQPFTGWKGSGGSGKGGCGPYYVAQFMREQSRTVVVED